MFFLVFEFYRKGIQTNSNWSKYSQRLFLDQKKPTEHRRWTRRVPRPPQGWRARPTPLGAPLPRGFLVDPPDFFPMPTPLIHPQTSRTERRSGVLPIQASIATKTQSRPYSGTLSEGGTITGALHYQEEVVHRRGWGYVPVAMCLISLFLARVLDLTWSWCITSFAIIVGSYDVSPPLPSCSGLSFPFEFIRFSL